MALDPARFIVADCKKGRSVQSNLVAQAQSLYANLNTLSNPTQTITGQVTSGMNVLSSVSNAIRIGQPSTPGQQTSPLYNSTYSQIQSTDASSTSQGANVVLGAAGVTPSGLSAVTAINPNVAALAVTSATGIFQQVKAGNFNPATTASAIGSITTLANIASSVFSATTNTPFQQVVHCQASPYAVDLIHRAPRNKFMFVVQFIFNSPYASQFDAYGRGTAFVVKTSTRPVIDFEYDEVNMYNFRTRVPKRTIYEPMSMSFYDDNLNNVTNFYNSYLQAYSPISNMGGSTSAVGTVSHLTAPTPDLYAADSMNNNLSATSSASLGSLQGNNVTLLQSIRVFHIYNYGNAMTVYNFFNPKITRLTPDELTMMESGNGSEMQMEFAYDGLYVVPEYDLTNTSPFNLQQLTSGGLYPIIPTFASTNKNVATAIAPQLITGSPSIIPSAGLPTSSLPNVPILA